MDEWVEIKGASVEVAVQAGLAELGIDDREQAEIEILQAPEKGFLGIGGKDAIVRVKPRPKPKRKRSRNKKGRGRGDGGSSDDRGSDGRAPRKGGSRSGGRDGERGDRSRGGQGGRQGGSRQDSGGRGSGDRPRDDHSSRDRSSRDRSSRDRSRGGQGRSEQKDRNGGRRDRDRRSSESRASTEAENVDINEQATVIEHFLSGLLDSFGLEGSVNVRVDDDVVYADLDGEQTEALIGPKAAILQAIHELTKTVVQRKTMAGVRLRLDIGGYAERRREALTIYAGRLAEQVIDENAEIMLEPMNPADRKTVHDAVAEIEGVRSFSEGEDPRRSVVLAPDS